MITSIEAEVVQAAIDLITAEEGDRYGPMQKRIQEARIGLYEAVCNLQAESDGSWTNPTE